MRYCIHILLLILFGPGPAPAQVQPVLHYRTGKVFVWPAQDNAALKVYRGALSPAQSFGKTAVLGRRSTSADTLFFQPLAPFRLGETYTAIYADSLTLYFTEPLPEDYAVPTVEQAFPSADTLPANLLKFHLRFSRPMQAGNVYPHIALLSAAGDTIDRAILPLEPPLWNADRSVLTLWLEPGRIKRDLGPNQKLGPILEAGKRYTLAIDGGLKDENGLPLNMPYRQTFNIGARDTVRPDATAWELTPPAAASQAPLAIRFEEIMDWATATTYLQVETRAGEPLSGAWRLSGHERQAEFVPAHPWQPGRYRLRIDPKVEDVAGNNLHRLFDRKAGKEPTTQSATLLEFTIE